MVEENGFFKMFLVREYAKHAFLISGWANASGNLNSTEARRMCFWKMFPVKSMLSVKVWSTRREWGSVVCQIISKDFVAFLGIKHIWCLLSLLQQKMYQWECHCAGANCSWGEVGWTVAINCPITPYRRREYNIGTTLRAESESTKEHNLHMGTDWLFLRRFCVIQPNPLSLPWRGSNTTRKMCNKEEFTKSSESQRSHWEAALRVLRLYKTLMCKASLCRIQLIETKASHFLPSFVSCFSSALPPEPLRITLTHSSLFPRSLQKVWKKYLMLGQKHKKMLLVSAFQRKWHDRNASITESAFRKLPLANDIVSLKPLRLRLSLQT